MITVSIQEAQRDLPKLLARVASGEEIIIAVDDKEIAVVSPPVRSLSPRVPGSAKGKVTVSSDFDSPLPDDVLESFER